MSAGKWRRGRGPCDACGAADGMTRAKWDDCPVYCVPCYRIALERPEPVIRGWSRGREPRGRVTAADRLRLGI